MKAIGSSIIYKDGRVEFHPPFFEVQNCDSVIVKPVYETIIYGQLDSGVGYLNEEKPSESVILASPSWTIQKMCFQNPTLKRKFQDLFRIKCDNVYSIAEYLTWGVYYRQAIPKIRKYMFSNGRFETICASAIASIVWGQLNALYESFKPTDFLFVRTQTESDPTLDGYYVMMIGKSNGAKVGAVFELTSDFANHDEPLKQLQDLPQEFEFRVKMLDHGFAGLETGTLYIVGKRGTHIVQDVVVIDNGNETSEVRFVLQSNPLITLEDIEQKEYDHV